MRKLHAKAYAEVENEDKRKQKELAVKEAVHTGKTVKEPDVGPASIHAALGSIAEDGDVTPATLGGESPLTVRATTDNKTKEASSLLRLHGLN